MTQTCGCCAGIEAVTPAAIANRPGLSALAYRVGTHATFLETMLARLARIEVEGGGRPLAGLTTRSTEDPAIALLDAWAVVADVLTFYQERIANEGYLRTATERRSVLELGRLVGYRLRPGVAASAYLAYTVEQGGRVTIPAGSRVQSVPGPGELPQTFETSEPLDARGEWNDLGVRRTRPQQIEPDRLPNALYVAGADSGLVLNDAILLIFDDDPDDPQWAMLVVHALEPDREHDRTRVLVTAIEPPGVELSNVGSIVTSLLAAPARPLANALRLPRTLGSAFGLEDDRKTVPAPISDVNAPIALEASGGGAVRRQYGELVTRMLTRFEPLLAPTLYHAWGAARTTALSALRAAYRLRATAGLFGQNAPRQPKFVGGRAHEDHYRLADEPTIANTWGRYAVVEDDGLSTLLLDAEYPEVVPGSWVLVEHGEDRVVRMVETAESVTASAVGVSMRVTKLRFHRPWRDQTNVHEALTSSAFLAETTVHLRSEALTLAEEPIDDPRRTDRPRAPVEGDVIELAGVADGIDSGRWIIVCGDRMDVPVRACEQVMIASVGHRPGGVDDLRNDTTHAVLTVVPKLQYRYVRDSVTIYGNVVHATHGESRDEVLGSGDATKTLQAFPLKQAPVTYRAAPTPEGAESTLRVWVNSVEWHEGSNLAVLGPTDRRFITTTDDDERTTVVFGTGEHGVRPPTGIENLRARYRSGMGRGGNVGAGQLSLLATRPLGVKGVVNPLPATGGADADTRDQARGNVPIAIKALDRLVSVEDYGDFARTFAGIGKAAAAHVTDGHRQLLHLTIAGAGDIPIDPKSDLQRNLLRALRDAGDPALPIVVTKRELLALVLVGNVRIRSDYLWEVVAAALRTALLDRFGFDRQELAQDVVSSEVLATMHAVEGVAWVDVDAFGAIPESRDPETIAQVASKLGPCDRIAVHGARAEGGTIRAAQIACFLPDAPDALILNQVTS